MLIMAMHATMMHMHVTPLQMHPRTFQIVGATVLCREPGGQAQAQGGGSATSVPSCDARLAPAPKLGPGAGLALQEGGPCRAPDPLPWPYSLCCLQSTLAPSVWKFLGCICKGVTCMCIIAACIAMIYMAHRLM